MTTLQLPAQSLDTGTFNVDFPSLIKVLGENLYSNPRACVRELIQNANDSCVRRQAAGETFQPAIRVVANKDERTLIFEDNGAGMVHDDVVRYLASIGGGRTRQERTRLSTEDKQAANMLIGQFGIGFLSSFVVADRVIVDTLSIDSNEGVRWICEGTAEYQIGKGDRSTPGTTVMLQLKPAHYDLVEEEILTATIVYYADFIGFPIYLNQRAAPINRMQAPWHQQSSDADYLTYIKHRYDVAPLAMQPINVEKDDLNLQGVLFVPPRSTEWKRHLRSIDIFQKRMFIGEDLSILPEWAGFVSGILDCATLDLVASRESAINDRPSYKALRAYLNEAVAMFVHRLATEERGVFLDVIKQHEWAVKWGAVRDDFFFNQVKDLIPISSDMGPLTIPRYLQRTPERLGGLKTIYFVPGSNAPGQQQSNIFRARGVPIYRADVVDEQFLKKYAERDKNINLRQMVSGVIELMDFVEGDQWRGLESRYEALGINARGVRFHPPDMPALAVRRSDYDKDSMISQVVEGERALTDFINRVGKETSDAYDLCFNIDNPIIQRLATYNGSPAILEAVLRAIHSSALLAAGVELTAETSQAVAQAEMRIIELVLEQDARLSGQPGASTYVPAAAAPAPTPASHIIPAPQVRQDTPVLLGADTSQPARARQQGGARRLADTLYERQYSHTPTEQEHTSGADQMEYRSLAPSQPTQRSAVPEYAAGQPMSETPVTEQSQPAEPATQAEPTPVYKRPFRDSMQHQRHSRVQDVHDPDARPFRDPEHEHEHAHKPSPRTPMFQASAVSDSSVSSQDYVSLFSRLMKKLRR